MKELATRNVKKKNLKTVAAARKIKLVNVKRKKGGNQVTDTVPWT